MTEQIQKRIQYLVLITDLKNKDKFLSLLDEFGGRAIDTIYGHSSVSASSLSRAFGFKVEKSKILITCLIASEKAQILIDELYNKHSFNKPNTGIAFTVPVDGILV